MDTVEIIKKECAAKGTSIKALEAELAIGNGTISKWKTSSPKAETLIKIATYFNVTVDYLLGRENEKPAAVSDGLSGGDVSAIPESELDERLVELLVNLDPADTERVIGYLEGLREKHK